MCCLPEIVSSDIYERSPRYLGEPRRRRLSMVRPNSRSVHRIGYREHLYPRDDMMVPYRPSMGMGMNHMGMGMSGMHHMGGMNHMGGGIPPPPPMLPPPPPPPGNFGNGMHSNGMMSPPMNQFNGGSGDHGVIQFPGNDMGGGHHGMNNRMHGGGQFGMGGHMGGQRYIEGPSGPRSPMPRGMGGRHGSGFGGGWGGGGSFGSEDSYGSGMYNSRNSYSSDDMFIPRQRQFGY